MEERIAEAKQKFVTDKPRWSDRPWLYPLDWFEDEIDALLGVTHARYVTQTMRKATA